MHLVLSLFLFLGHWLSFQSNDDAFYRQQLLSANDTVKVNAAMNLAHRAKFKNPQEHKFMINIVKSVAQKGIVEAKIIALKMEGEYWYVQGKKELGFKLLDSAILLSKKAKWYSGIAVINQDKANLLLKESKYAESLKNFYEAIKYVKVIDDEKLLMALYSDLGTMLYQMGDYVGAEKYFRLTNKLHSKSIIDSNNAAVTLLDIGLCRMERKDYNSALKYYNEALHISEQNPKFTGLSACIYGDIGAVYVSLKNYPEAIKYLRKDVSTSYRLGNYESYFNACLEVSKLFTETNQLDSAKKYVEKAETIDFKKTPLTIHSYIKLYKSKAEVYAKSGDYKKAYDNLYEFSSKYNSIVLADNKIKEEGLRTKYELEALDEELNKNKLLLKEKEQILNTITQQRSILIFVVISSLVLIFFTVYNVIQKSKFAKELVGKQDIIIIQNNQVIESNEKLQYVLKQKTHIMGVVSHDLKAPINRVKGLIDLIHLDPENEEQYQEMLKLSIIDANALIQNLLDNSALEEGRSIMRPQNFDSILTLNTIVKVLGGTASFKGITVQFIHDVPFFEVYHDKLSFTRIVENLLSNAIKFSPKNTRIVVGINFPESEKFEVYVQDEGPGIPPEDQEKLFSPFQRGTAIPTAGESSTGLGLSIVDKLVTLNQGKIVLVSHLGKGAKFSIILPCQYSINSNDENHEKDLELLNMI